MLDFGRDKENVVNNQSFQIYIPKTLSKMVVIAIKTRISKINNLGFGLRTNGFKRSWFLFEDKLD